VGGGEGGNVRQRYNPISVWGVLPWDVDGIESVAGDDGGVGVSV